MQQSTHSRRTAGAGPAADGIIIRRAGALADYEECVAIQEETWGTGFSERVPASILLVTQKLGGVVAVAAARDGRLLGFVFGLTGLQDGALIHWSDMLAVRPEARGTGIGERLKRYQRELVRSLGIDTMRWTFDPLVAHNAYLNLTRLGARAIEYVPNMYGDNTRSPLHGAGDTDRLVASWDLTVETGGDGHASPEVHGAPVINEPDVDGVPALRGLPDVGVVRIAVPTDIHRLPTGQRLAWRATTREAFLTYLARGYDVVAFRRGSATALPCYELARGGVAAGDVAPAA